MLQGVAVSLVELQDLETQTGPHHTLLIRFPSTPKPITTSIVTAYRGSCSEKGPLMIYVRKPSFLGIRPNVVNTTLVRGRLGALQDIPLKSYSCQTIHTSSFTIHFFTYLVSPQADRCVDFQSVEKKSLVSVLLCALCNGPLPLSLFFFTLNFLLES